MTQIFTIGHSNRQWNEFIRLLEDNRVVTIVDVRRHPGSKSFPQFNKENMAKELLAKGIRYAHIKNLGGRRKETATGSVTHDNSGWQDKDRISQVISNILDNAAKFVKEGTVTISMDTNSITNNYVGNNPGDGLNEIIVNIKDSGTGIDPEILPRLFSKFTFKDGSGGSGLGLYICKNIVEAHGGRIWAKNNEDGKGATFRFSLPVGQH